MVKQLRFDQMKKKKEITWHCCRVSLFNMQMRCPKKCKCKRLKCLKENYNEQILMNHYRQIEKEVSVTYILLQLRILKGLAKAKMTKQEWETKKIQHGYPDLEHMMRERLEKKLIKDEKVFVPEIRRNSVVSQLD